jgi:hypothetical protein
MVLCFSACLVQFCHLPNSRRAIVLSLVTGFLIWTKIGAMFTIVLLLILALMVWMRERQKKVIVMLLSPVAIMLLSLMSYQNIHEGVFAFSPWGGFSKMGRSLPNWSTHPDYPDEVNAGIEKAMSKLDPKDREIMTSSWDARKVWQAYQNNWSRCRYGSFKASAPHLQDAFAQLGNDGVAANPIDYLRFVTSMATMHFWVYPTLDSQAHLVNHLHRHQQTLEKRNKDGARSVYFEPLYRPMSLNDFDQEPLFGFFHPYRDYMKTYTLLKPSLRHAFWPSIWMITLCFLIFRVFQSKFKDQILICSGCLCLAPLGAGLLVSMFEVAILRYSYPLEFIYYLSPFLLFIALPTSWTIKFQSWFGFFEQPTTKNIAFGFSVLLAFFITKQVLWSGLDSYGAKDMPLEELSMRIGAANHEALPQLARQLRNLKSYPHAIDASLETLRINPQHLHAQFELMLTREAMGDATAAAAELQKLLRMQPRTPLEIFLLGQAYIKNKNVNQAIQLYRNARKKFPNFHPSQFQGLSPQQKQQWDKILSSP